MVLVRSAAQLGALKERLADLPDYLRDLFELRAGEMLRDQGPLVVLWSPGRVLATPLKPRAGRTRHLSLASD